MEAAGAVCLPAAGYRDGYTVKNFGVSGSYWSSSPYGSSTAYYVLFNGIGVYPVSSVSRYFGSSVRLITDVK